MRRVLLRLCRGPWPRRAIALLVAGVGSGLLSADHAVAQTSSACVTGVSPKSMALLVWGNSGPFTVDAPSGCEWTSSSDSEWLRASGYVYPFNRGWAAAQRNQAADARAGKVRVGIHTVAVAQEGTCEASVSQAIMAFHESGGSGSVTLTTACAWRVAALDDWVSVTSAPTGTGDTVVTFQVSPNLAVATRETVVLVGSRAVRIGQSGSGECAVMLSSHGVTVYGTLQTETAQVHTETVQVAAAPGCAWPVTGGHDWLSVSPTGGVGDGTVTLTALPYLYGGQRWATVRVAALNFDLMQLSAKACSAIWPNNRAMPASGGDFSVKVVGPADCTWSFEAPPWASWIRPSRSSGTGPADLTITVDPFTSLFERRRSASVSIGVNGLSVVQAPPPSTWWNRPLSSTNGFNYALGESARISEDGRFVVADGRRWADDGTAEDDVGVYDAALGSWRAVGLPGAGYGQPSSLALSGDGRHLMFSSMGRYALLDLLDGSIEPLQPPEGRWPVAMDAQARFFLVRGISELSIWDRAAGLIRTSLPASLTRNGVLHLREGLALSGDGSTVLIEARVIEDVTGILGAPPGAVPPQSVPKFFQRWRWQDSLVTDVPGPPSGRPIGQLNCNSNRQDFSFVSSAAINGDGTRVAFGASRAQRECSSGRPLWDVYLFDAGSGRVTLVSGRPDGQPAQKGAWPFSIDSAGRFVSFSTEAVDLPFDPPLPDWLTHVGYGSRIFRYDAESGHVERIRIPEFEGVLERNVLEVPPHVGTRATGPNYPVGRLSGDGLHFVHTYGLFTYGHRPSDLRIESIVPDTGQLLTDTDVTIAGSGFVNGTRILLGNGPELQTKVHEPTQLTVRVPAYLASERRVLDVRAVTPDGRSAELIGAFRVRSCDEHVWTMTVLPPHTVHQNVVNVISSDAFTLRLQLETASPCRWTIDAPADWVTVEPQSGIGNALVEVRVAAMAGATEVRRFGFSWSVPGAVYRQILVMQYPKHPDCTINVTPPQVTVGGEATTLTLGVQTGLGCAWTVGGLPDWIQATPMSGSGPGAVELAIASAPARGIRGVNLTIGPRIVPVTQILNCTYSFEPATGTIGHAGGEGTFQVTGSHPACTPAFRNAYPWAPVTKVEGVGPWTVTYTVTPNPDAMVRSAVLSTQPVSNAWFSLVQQARDCVDAVSPATINAPPEGGTYRIDIVTLPGTCYWSAQVVGGTAASFVRFKTPAAGATSGSFTLEVPANRVAQGRAANLKVGNRDLFNVWVVQAASDEPDEPPTPSTFERFLAEGATSSLFDVRLALVNPGVTPTTARLTFARAGTGPVKHDVLVPAGTRVTLDPKSIPGLAEAEFSTAVESDQPLVMDRTMTWDASGYGAHAETAVVAPAPKWYLAEGATHSGFNLFYLLQNPNPVVAEVRVRYLRPSGTPLEKTYSLPATSRTNIWVDFEEFPGLGQALAGTDVSAVVEVLNGQPIIVERAMYADVPGQLFGAGHESAGITAPATEWFLAEGATGSYFDLFVLLANPGETDATVEATYLLPDGTTVTKPYVVRASSRFNIWVDYEDARLADTAVSTTIRSTNGVPVIVERSMWWPGDWTTWYEAHNSAGATSTGTTWALAEGEVDAARNLETYILVANTSATAATVRVTLLFEDGTKVEQTYAVPARSRFNVPVGGFFQQAVGRRFGAIVESVGAVPAEIVVERAMYWDAAGQFWAAGTNALATKLH